MEISDEISDAWEVLGVEIFRTRLPFSWDQWVILGADRKPLNLDASGFMPPYEEDRVI